MNELIKPEKNSVKPKVYRFAEGDNLFNATLEKDHKKISVMRTDNGPTVEAISRFQDTILVSSEAGLCKDEIKNYEDKIKELVYEPAPGEKASSKLRFNDTLVNKIFAEISKEFIIEEKNIKSFKAIFINKKKELDEKLRITKSSISDDNEVFIGNFDKIT